VVNMILFLFMKYVKDVDGKDQLIIKNQKEHSIH